MTLSYIITIGTVLYCSVLYEAGLATVVVVVVFSS